MERKLRGGAFDMARSFLIGSISLLLGAGLTYLILPAPDARYLAPANQIDAAARDDAERTLASLLAGRFGVGERAAVYGIVAAAELDTLKGMAGQLWSADPSPNRGFMLDVILSRITEIDRDAGIDLIREANPGDDDVFAAALAIVAARGISDGSIEDVLAALPELDEQRFKSAAFSRLSATDTAQATAVVLVDEAPSSPLLEDGADLSTIRELSKTDPRRALELADRLEGEAREIGITAAIQAWGQEDPYGALGTVVRLAPGRDRDILLQAIGEEIGRQDPEGALSWFNSLDAPAHGLYGSILRGIAETEPKRALKLALDSADPSATGAVMFLMAAAVQSGDMSFGELAEQVLATDTGAGREAGVQMLVNAWAKDDADAALSWLVRHSENVGQSAVRQAALAVAWQDPEAAMRYTQSLPDEYREGWIRAVASGYAQNDPAGAQAWIEQYRGEAVYDAGLTAIVEISALRDPAAAAELLSSFANSAARDRAATTIATQWAGRQPRAARNWVTTLPTGPVRDAALTGLMMVSDDVPDAATLASFQSDEARQQAILNVAFRKARYDLEDARAIVERHIENPALRGQAEQVFETIRLSPG